MRITGACVGCGHCKVFCPAGAIETCGISTINDKCVECGKCTEACPQHIPISEWLKKIHTELTSG